MVDQIKRAFDVAQKRNFKKLYYFFDIHETIIIPDWSNTEPLRFYPYAKEALQLITSGKPITFGDFTVEIVNGLFTCSHPEEIEWYQGFFKEHDIHFKYVNENPEVVNTRLGCFDKKPYMNVLFEDKAGFEAQTDWRAIYYYFAELQSNGQEVINIDFKFLYPHITQEKFPRK